MKKHQKASENFLERKPMRKQEIHWTKNDEGSVTLEIENRGVANKLAQWLLHKPKVSYIHLDEIGSFIWPLLDGKQNLIEIGEKLTKAFGEQCNPVYERLAEYIRILDSYQLILWNCANESMIKMK